MPAPTYPANISDVPGDDFSPLEVETYFIEPVATDIQVFYTIPAEGWLGWIGTFKPERGTDAPYQLVGMSIVNVTNVVQEGCTTHAAADPPVGPTVDDMARRSPPCRRSSSPSRRATSRSTASAGSTWS